MDIATTAVLFPVLERFCHEALERMGVGHEEADILADVLLQGALRSVPGQGQGIQRLPEYYQRIKGGAVAIN